MLVNVLVCNPLSRACVGKRSWLAARFPYLSPLPLPISPPPRHNKNIECRPWRMNDNGVCNSNYCWFFFQREDFPQRNVNWQNVHHKTFQWCYFSSCNIFSLGRKVKSPKFGEISFRSPLPKFAWTSAVVLPSLSNCKWAKALKYSISYFEQMPLRMCPYLTPPYYPLGKMAKIDDSYLNACNTHKQRG